MSDFPATDIDKIGFRLHALAEAYANEAEDLASDPYFREAVMKVSVSSFVWALYDQFDHRSRQILAEELLVQAQAVSAAIATPETK